MNKAIKKKLTMTVRFEKRDDVLKDPMEVLRLVQFFELLMEIDKRLKITDRVKDE